MNELDEICRLYKQSYDTIIKTNAKNHDIIQPYNERNIGNKVCPTLTTRPEGLKTAIHICERNGDDIKVRKLTPRECFRLMGVDDEDIDKIINDGISDYQMWKLSGNSIVVDCLANIFDNLFNKEFLTKTSLW